MNIKDVYWWLFKDLINNTGIDDMSMLWNTLILCHNLETHKHDIMSWMTVQHEGCE